MKLFIVALPFVLFWTPIQDPGKPPQAPPGAPPLPVIQDPMLTPQERTDLWQRFVPASPIAGMYRLRMAMRDGRQIVDGMKGYLTVGERHLSLHLVDENVNPRRPMLQSSFREYRLVGSRLQMTSLVGMRTKADGDVVLDGAGLVELRDVLVLGNTLRVLQSANDYLDFERIE